MSILISLLITVLVIFLVLYLVQMLPLDARAKQIAQVIVDRDRNNFVVALSRRFLSI